MTLQTVYETEAIEIIRNFISDVATYYGGSQKECFELSLACEESSIHIIENYPSNKNDIFEISCTLEKDMLKVVFNNKGIPVDSENIPQYDKKNPNDSIDGLKFFLIKKLTDDFYFKNRGSLGWQTILYKNILTPKLINPQNKEKEFITKDKLIVTLATAQDAYEITKLAYYTYSYSYAKTIFYYPELLSEAIRNKTIISHIVKNTNNEIVGHLGLIKSPHCLNMAESGMMMVAPKYRKTMAILRLLKSQYKLLLDGKYNFKLFYANLVTSHDISQRLITNFNLKPFALKLSVHEQSEILDIDTNYTQRETHLYSLSFIKQNIETFNIFIPSKHNTIVKKLFDSISLVPNISNKTLKPIRTDTQFNIENFVKEFLVEIKVESFGNNLYQNLKKILKRYSVDGYKTIHLHIPLNKPLPETLESDLNKLGFFFSGVIAKSIDRWYILYATIEYQKFDFNKIVLYKDLAKDLFNYIKNEYEELE
jgi:anti-sigma regulatory factor (Ser/Thr protein kinase)